MIDLAPDIRITTHPNITQGLYHRDQRHCQFRAVTLSEQALTISTCCYTVPGT